MSNPKFLKNEDGFCYVYTDALATIPELTPYDGDIDAHGMATEFKAPKVSKSKAAKADAADAAEQTPAE